MGRSERHTDAFGQIAAPDRHARTPMCGPSAYKSRSACASCISGRLSCRLGVPLTASPHVEPTAERAAKALVLTPRPAPPPFVPPPVPPTMTFLGGGVHRGTSSLKYWWQPAAGVVWRATNSAYGCLGVLPVRPSPAASSRRVSCHTKPVSRPLVRRRLTPANSAARPALLE